MRGTWVRVIRPASARAGAKVTMKKNYVLDTNVLIHDPHAFLKHSHAIDLSPVPRDPAKR